MCRESRYSQNTSQLFVDPRIIKIWIANVFPSRTTAKGDMNMGCLPLTLELKP